MTKKIGCVLIIEMAKTKDKAFALFSLKKVPTSPEVKALGIKAGTRWNYFNEWKKLGKPSPDVPEAELGLAQMPKKAKEKQRRAPSETVMLPGHETIGPYRPMVSEASEKPSEAEKESEPDEAAVGEIKPESEAISIASKPSIEIKLEGDHEHPSIPEKVIGAGLPVAVNLSLKTLSFYEIIATIDPKVTLGDFIDDCVQDFFTGRGQDLGLVKIGGQHA